MHLIFFLYAVMAFLAFYLLVWTHQILTSPLRDVPGPFLARLTNLWYLYNVRQENFEKKNIALHQKYGPIVRIAPNKYSIATPDKAVYGIGSKFVKSDWYDGFRPSGAHQWSIFTDRNLKRHAETRKKFQNIYSMSSLVTYEAYVDKCTKIFSQRLTEFADNNSAFNFGHWLTCYAFDVIGEITYSQRFGFLDAGHDIAGMLRVVHNTLVYSTLVGIVAWLHPYISSITQFLPDTGANGREYLQKTVGGRIAERGQVREQREQAGKKASIADEEAGLPKDFLDKISDNRAANPEKVTSFDVFMMTMSNIVAGSDTTGISLSAIFYYLLREPNVMAKLRQEIDEAITDGRADNSHIKFHESQKLPYLQAVIKESLRMHGAVGLPLWRDVPKGGAEICGRFFPEGTTVGLNPWVAHYSTEVFGPDATRFRPERWIEAEKEGGDILKKMDSYYVPFGLGSRTCLGRHISTLEMSKVVPQIIKDFDFDLDIPGEDWRTSNYWFVKPVGFQVKVKRREHKV